MDKESVIGSLIRHALGAAGSSLATHGILTAAQVEPFVGAVMVLGSIILSLIHKYRSGQ